MKEACLIEHAQTDLNSHGSFNYSSDPSIEGDTPFKSCESPNEIFCQEISNEPKSHVTYSILERLHYYVWHEIEEIFKKKSTNGQTSDPDRTSNPDQTSDPDQPDEPITLVHVLCIIITIIIIICCGLGCTYLRIYYNKRKQNIAVDIPAN